jgi:hypothetical protein
MGGKKRAAIILAHVGLGILATFLVGCSKPAASFDPGKQLTDDEIATYAVNLRQASFRQRMAGPTQVLGVHNGTRVIAEVACTDDGDCSRLGVVRYDAEPGEACRQAGGAVRLEWVPAAIAIAQKPFCVPKVLVDRNIQTYRFK